MPRFGQKYNNVSDVTDGLISASTGIFDLLQYKAKPPEEDQKTSSGGSSLERCSVNDPAEALYYNKLKMTAHSDNDKLIAALGDIFSP